MLGALVFMGVFLGLLIVVSAGHSADGAVDYHSVAGMVDVASSSCDSID